MFVVFVLSLALCVALASFVERKGFLTVAAQHKRLGSLDGARGILALMVALHHYFMWINLGHGDPWQGPATHWHNTAGQTGVALFFMISGALFYGIILKSLDDVNWRSLYISRLFRIYPLVFAAVLAMMVLIALRGGQWQMGDGARLMVWLSTVWTPSLMGQDDLGTILGVTWTLKYEWAFYLSLPLMALVLRMVRSSRIRIVLLAATTFGLLALEQMNLGLPLRPFFFAFFTVGMICFEFGKTDVLRPALQSRAAAVLAVLILALQMTAMPATFNVTSLALLAPVFLTIVSGNTFFGILRHRGLLALGEVSYSIYLIHGLVLTVMMREGGLMEIITPNPVLQMAALPVVMLSITVVATISYVLIERPGIWAGRHVAKWRWGPRTAPSAS